MRGRGPFARGVGAPLRIALVGPCGVGKSTVAARLRGLGWEVRMPAQEHSGVPDMWRKLLDPDLLIALNAPDAILRVRRPGVDLSVTLLAAERRRLAHAFAHADLTLDTSRLTVDEVVAAVRACVERTA